MVGKDLYDQGKIIQVWLTLICNNNAIRNQKHFKPIHNGNVAKVA